MFDHFHCIKIGLTATPYVFDSEIDESNEDTIIVGKEEPGWLWKTSKKETSLVE